MRIDHNLKHAFSFTNEGNDYEGGLTLKVLCNPPIKNLKVKRIIKSNKTLRPQSSDEILAELTTGEAIIQDFSWAWPRRPPSVANTAVPGSGIVSVTVIYCLASFA